MNSEIFPLRVLLIFYVTGFFPTLFLIYVAGEIKIQETLKFYYEKLKFQFFLPEYFHIVVFLRPILHEEIQ
jgi:hypothetical protein